MPAFAIAVSGPTAYFLEFGDLAILDVTSPPTPKLTSLVNNVGLYGIAVSGNKICVTDNGKGLTVLYRTPAAPRLESRLGGSAYRLSLMAEPGQEVHMQRSRDLIIWEDWMTLTADGSAQEIDDPDLSSHLAQFYRAVTR